MSKSIVLARGISLPLEVVNQTIGVIAKRRVGKSYTARRLCEQVYDAGVQLVIVDPKGDHWGIRSAADGKGPGLPIVILGGGHGDAPLEVGSGEIVAKLVAEDRVSVLLDLSLFRKHEVATFMTSFLENVYRLKAHEKFRTPLFMVLEEADAIAAQKPPKGHERMLGAADDIVRRGGQRGIGVALITQRSAVINKNVLTQCEMLIALKTIAPQDRAALEAWIEVHGTPEQREKLMAELSHLPKGDAYFWSPGWPTDDGIFQRAHVLPIKTFDSGKSPEVGEKRIEPKKLADVDLVALTKQMAATIERAKQDDPKLLRGEIAELRKRVAQRDKVIEDAVANHERKPARAAVAAAKKEQLDAAFARGSRAESRRWRKPVAVFERAAAQLVQLGRDAIALGDMVMLALNESRALEVADVERPDPTPAVPAQKFAKAAVETARIASGAVHVVGPEDWPKADKQQNGDLSQRIVDRLAGLADCNIIVVPRVVLATLVGMHPRTASFMETLKAMRVGGVIDDVSGGGITLTYAGARQRSNDAPPTASLGDLHRAFYAQLKPLAAKLLAYIIEQYPNEVSREQLASFAGMHVRTESFIDALSTLTNLGIVAKVRGGVVADVVLFPQGLPR